MKEKQKARKIPPLESGLNEVMSAIDSQIARRMQRTPSERSESGVQKWEPYSTKIEEVASLILQRFADEASSLDSIQVLSQAFSKSLYLLVEELGEEGLGATRSEYCLEALENIQRDVEVALSVFKKSRPSLN